MDESDNKSHLAKLLLIAAVAAAVIIMLRGRVLWMNGTYYQRWSWQWIATARIFPPMLLAAVPTLATPWMSRRWLALSMMAISLLALQLIAVGIQSEPWSIERIIGIVYSSQTTSYFTDAARFQSALSLGAWIGHFPELAQTCAMHAREKPPGQILYYMVWQKWFGLPDYDRAAFFGGLMIAVLGAAGVFTTYFMGRAMELTERAARLSAATFSLLPAMLLFCPSFDQVYPALTGLIIGTWAMALRTASRTRIGWALACGGVTALASFLAYSPLTLGAFCAAAGLVRLMRGQIRFAQLTFLVGGVLLPMIMFYGLLWITTAFDPLSMYRHAYANEMSNEASFPIHHLYPNTLPTDIKDFFAGSAWIVLPMFAFGLCRARRLAAGTAVWLAAGQIAVVWLSGLLKCETSRIWLFLQPLAMVAVGVELAAWRRWQQSAFLTTLAIVTISIVQNLLCFAPD